MIYVIKQLASSGVKLGTLNVVDPLPSPYVEPIAKNSALYVVRDTSAPSHNKYPSGRDPDVFVRIVPVGGDGSVGQ